MSDRAMIERLLAELYAARLSSELDRMCRLFLSDARLEIAGVSYATPMAIKAMGSTEIRTWLALLVKTFQLDEREVLSTIVENDAAAVHWRCRVRSKITGNPVRTELMDIIRVRDDHIAAYTEFFVPR